MAKRSISKHEFLFCLPPSRCEKAQVDVVLAAPRLPPLAASQLSQLPAASLTEQHHPAKGCLLRELPSMPADTVGFKSTAAIDLCTVFLSTMGNTRVNEREAGCLESRTQDVQKLASQEIFPNMHSWLERD